MSPKVETISLHFCHKLKKIISVLAFFLKFSIRQLCAADAAQTKQVREHFFVEKRGILGSVNFVHPRLHGRHSADGKPAHVSLALRSGCDCVQFTCYRYSGPLITDDRLQLA